MRWMLALVFVVAPDAGAQESGLLLGVAVSEPAPAPGYHSLWIARENGRVGVLASGPDLIVPRRSGFWRICRTGGYSLDNGALTEWDSLVAVPATPARGACAATPPVPTEHEQSSAQCQATTRGEILFLGTDFVSLEQHEATDCGAHYSEGTSAQLRSLDSAAPVDLERFLDPAGIERLVRQAMEAGQAEFGDLGDFGAAGSDDDSVIVPRLELLREWGIERADSGGSWRVVGHATCSPYVACGSGLRRFAVPGSVPPAALVGNDRLVPPIDRIRAAVPGLRDAVASPRGDLLAALTLDSLLVFTPSGNQLGTPVIAVPLYGRIIMAQGAVGRFVPVWTRELRRLLNQ